MKLINNTSGNDSCRSAFRACDLPIVEAIGMASGYVPVLWTEDEDPAQRESGSAFRYCVEAYGDDVFATNDYAEALAELEAIPEPAALPATKEEALAMLRGMLGVGAVWHLDDDPRTIISDLTGRRTFTAQQAAWCSAFVAVLNQLFAEAGDGAVVNAGAWRAADLVNWGGVS